MTMHNVNKKRNEVGSKAQPRLHIRMFILELFQKTAPAGRQHLGAAYRASSKALCLFTPVSLSLVLAA